jgi:hypothetical protein
MRWANAVARARPTVGSVAALPFVQPPAPKSQAPTEPKMFVRPGDVVHDPPPPAKAAKHLLSPAWRMDRRPTIGKAGNQRETQHLGVLSPDSPQ